MCVFVCVNGGRGYTLTKKPKLLQAYPNIYVHMVVCHSSSVAFYSRKPSFVRVVESSPLAQRGTAYCICLYYDSFWHLCKDVSWSLARTHHMYMMVFAEFVLLAATTHA